MKDRAKRVGLLVAAWDTAWKTVAIRRAIGARQWKWVPLLAFANTAGILPMLYLSRWSKTPAEAPATEADEDL